MFKFTFFIWAVMAIDSIVQGCDELNCSDVPKIFSRIFYEEIGCTQGKEDIDGFYFKCPERPTDGKCHFNGKSYIVGETIPENDQPMCLHSCTCFDFGNEEPVFRCMDIECPEYFRPEINRTIVSEHGKCCGTSVYNEERTELSKTKCYIEGKEYIKGEFMISGCHGCICAEDFDNSTIFNNPNCERSKCFTDIHYSHRINNGCIPIFHKEFSCCASFWRCPESTDEVVSKKHTMEQASDSKLTCNFGKLKLAIGDQLNSSEKGVTCSCSVPPMVHCLANRY